MRHKVTRSALVGASILGISFSLLAPATAQAATPAYLADPDFQALAVASTYTQGVTRWGADIYLTSTLQDGSLSMDIAMEAGFNAYTGTSGEKTVMNYSDITPMPTAMPKSIASTLNTVFAAKDFAENSAPAVTAQEDSSEPMPPSESSVFWLGSTPGQGNFENLQRSYLGDAQRKALRMAGAPKAQFLTSWEQEVSYYTQVMNSTGQLSPGAIQAALVSSAEYGSIMILDTTSTVNEDGTTTYVVKVEENSAPFVGVESNCTFLVNADGIVTRFANNVVTGDDRSSNTMVELRSWGKDAVLAAALPETAITVDRSLYEAALEAVYAGMNLRDYAWSVASMANDAAALVGVQVSPRLIQRTTERNAPWDARFQVKNIGKGVSLSLVGLAFPTPVCRVMVAKDAYGEKIAVVRCATPVTDSIAPMPNPVTPR